MASFSVTPDNNMFIIEKDDMAVISCEFDILQYSENFYVIDIGANIGAYSLKIVRKFKHGFLVAIEPDPKNYKNPHSKYSS